MSLFDSFKVVQCERNLKKGRRKKCHWCQRSDSCSLIRCSNCQREFFCMDCIKQRLELGLVSLFRYHLQMLFSFFHCEFLASWLSLPMRCEGLLDQSLLPSCSLYITCGAVLELLRCPF